jgi:hypothetical protein
LSEAVCIYGKNYIFKYSVIFYNHAVKNLQEIKNLEENAHGKHNKKNEPVCKS